VWSASYGTGERSKTVISVRQISKGEHAMKNQGKPSNNLIQQAKEWLIAGYRNRFQQYGDTTEAVQLSAEGQQFRFRKLMEIGDLRGRHVLDLGCGIGDFYPLLKDRFGLLRYTGIDLVPEMIDHAAKKYGGARFLCRDLFTDHLEETFDYVLLSGVFNNAMPGCDLYMRELLRRAFAYCTLGLGFNFLSTHVSFTDVEMAYHDPGQVIDFSLRELTPKVEMQHHYERTDVVIFAYR
jgi:SAM-dependent methyltransferase